MQYRQGKEKRRNLPNWLCFTARRSKDSSTQQLHDVMVSRQSSHSMTSCPPQQIAVPFALHRLCNVLQMSTKLFVIKLVYFTISCSNSTWATRLFIIWLNYSCLGCSVSWRKTKPSIIWQCHSFISYSILQLILKPAFYLLIYLTSLYKWLWRPPIEPLFVSLPVVICQRRLTPPPLPPTP